MTATNLDLTVSRRVRAIVKMEGRTTVPARLMARAEPSKALAWISDTALTETRPFSGEPPAAVSKNCLRRPVVIGAQSKAF